MNKSKIVIIGMMFFVLINLSGCNEINNYQHVDETKMLSVEEIVTHLGKYIYEEVKVIGYVESIGGLNSYILWNDEPPHHLYWLRFSTTIKAYNGWNIVVGVVSEDSFMHTTILINVISVEPI